MGRNPCNILTRKLSLREPEADKIPSWWQNCRQDFHQLNFLVNSIVYDHIPAQNRGPSARARHLDKEYVPLIPRSYVAVVDEATARSLERYFKSARARRSPRKRFLATSG